MIECKITWQESAAMFTWLADVFYQTPNEKKLVDVTDNIISWPLLSNDNRTTITAVLSSIELDGFSSIRDDFTRMFIGPGKKEVYPWGSVYTDEEGLLFGPSTLAWEAFCKELNIEIKPESNEPTDHFALIFSALSAIIQSEYSEKDKKKIVKTILSTHLAPWGAELLTLVEQKAQTDYFRGFAKLATELVAYHSE